MVKYDAGEITPIKNKTISPKKKVVLKKVKTPLKKKTASTKTSKIKKVTSTTNLKKITEVTMEAKTTKGVPPPEKVVDNKVEENVLETKTVNEPKTNTKKENQVMTEVKKTNKFEYKKPVETVGAIALILSLISFILVLFLFSGYAPSTAKINDQVSTLEGKIIKLTHDSFDTTSKIARLEAMTVEIKSFRLDALYSTMEFLKKNPHYITKDKLDSLIQQLEEIKALQSKVAYRF
ncbi:MAG: hypothetical protein ABIA04_11225 [Pseudomonadota bacterium]